MKMKKLVAAIEPLQKLARIELPLTIAYSLKGLFDELQKDIDFYTAEMQKGTDPEDLLEFKIPDRKKVIVPVNGDVKLSVSDIEALDAFVAWDEVTKC